MAVPSGREDVGRRSEPGRRFGGIQKKDIIAGRACAPVTAITAGAFCAWLALATATPVSAQTVANAGFETPNVGSGTFGSFQYSPSGASWAFDNSSGISGNGSGFTGGNPNAPEGTQVAFIQQTGTFSQSISFTSAGNYVVSFLAAQRGAGGGPTPNQQTFTVSLAGTTVGTFTPAGTSYQSFTTSAVALAPGTYSLAFKGTNPIGGDNTAFIDRVAISVATTAAPEPGSLALATLPLLLVGMARVRGVRRRRA